MSFLPSSGHNHTVVSSPSEVSDKDEIYEDEDLLNSLAVESDSLPPHLSSNSPCAMLPSTSYVDCSALHILTSAAQQLTRLTNINHGTVNNHDCYHSVALDGVTGFDAAGSHDSPIPYAAPVAAQFPGGINPHNPKRRKVEDVDGESSSVEGAAQARLIRAVDSNKARINQMAESIQALGAMRNNCIDTHETEILHLHGVITQCNASISAKVRAHLFTEKDNSDLQKALIEAQKENNSLVKNLLRIERANNELYGEIAVLEARLANFSPVPPQYTTSVAREQERQRLAVAMTRRPVDAPRSLLYHGYSPQQIHKNGSGKVDPDMYGSGPSWDLGLCFAHFLTYERCEHGQVCEWRHRELTAEERDYIFKQGNVQFLLKADMFMDDKAS